MISGDLGKAKKKAKKADKKLISPPVPAPVAQTSNWKKWVPAALLIAGVAFVGFKLLKK